MSHPAMHRGYSWLCIQELLLAVLKGPYGMLGIEPRSASCDVILYSTNEYSPSMSVCFTVYFYT